MTNYTSFRQRLDAVLRTLDVEQVRTFLIAEKQWDTAAPADPEFAMWIMIASSPNLRHLHIRAQEWLLAHGHAEEAQSIFGPGKAAPSQPSRNTQQSRSPRGNKPAQTKQSNFPKQR